MKKVKSKLLNFAHRGSRGLNTGRYIFPENTLRAFTDAYNRCWDGVELDIQLTKDNQLVIYHDDTLQKHCQKKEHIRDFTLDELQSFTYSGFTDKILSFDDFLRSFKNKPQYLEIKVAEDLFDNKIYCIQTAEKFVNKITKEHFNNNSFIASSCPTVTGYCLKIQDKLPLPYVISHDFLNPFLQDYQKVEKKYKNQLWSIPYDVWIRISKEIQKDISSRCFIWGIPPKDLLTALYLPVKGVISDDFFGVDVF